MTFWEITFANQQPTRVGDNNRMIYYHSQAQAHNDLIADGWVFVYNDGDKAVYRKEQHIDASQFFKQEHVVEHCYLCAVQTQD